MKIEDIYSDLLLLETERLILRKIKMEEVEDIHTYIHILLTLMSRSILGLSSIFTRY